MRSSILIKISCFLIEAFAFESIASKLQPNYQWSHSLYAPYISFDGNNNNWNFDALVSMHDFIQLTPQIPHTSGSAFTKQQLTGKDWIVDFSFLIGGEHAADGLAFWFVKEKDRSGSAFGQDEVFNGIGIFIDAFNNAGDHSVPFPRVFAMINDGSKHYDHDSDGGDHVIGGCHLDLLNKQTEGRVVLLHETLEVSFKIEDGNWEQCLLIHGVKNIPSSGYIGFSAVNGEFAARNMLFSVTTGLLNGDTEEYHYPSTPQRSSSSASSYALLAFIVIGAFGGAFIYHRKNDKYHSI